MSYKEVIRKYGADKIFLLGLFALSLVLAFWIVSSRKSIVLSKPVEIPETGVSVRMPDGHGWISNENWQQSEDALVLNSIYQPGSKSALIDANCIYRLVSFRETGQQWLGSLGVDANEIEYGNIQTGEGELEWANIRGGQEQAGILAATMPLENGRWFDLEILYVGWEEQLAKEALNKIASSIVIEKNDLLDRGIAAVKRIKAAGLDKIINETNEPQCYLIKDTKNRDVGYSVEAVLKTAGGNGSEIHSASFAYLTSPYNLESASMFKSDADLGKFLWESETEQRKAVLLKRGNLVIQGPTEIIKANNTLTCEEDRLTINRLENENVRFEKRISEAAIPGAIGEAVYIEMINSGVEKLIADVIFENGKIVPVVLTVQKDEQNGHTVKMKYLGTNDEEETYLDENMRVTKKLLRQNIEFALEPAEVEELVRRFPERADFILQRIATMKQGKL